MLHSVQWWDLQVSRARIPFLFQHILESVSISNCFFPNSNRFEGWVSSGLQLPFRVLAPAVSGPPALRSPELLQHLRLLLQSMHRAVVGHLSHRKGWHRLATCQAAMPGMQAFVECTQGQTPSELNNGPRRLKLGMQLAHLLPQTVDLRQVPAVVLARKLGGARRFGSNGFEAGGRRMNGETSGLGGLGGLGGVGRECNSLHAL